MRNKSLHIASVISGALMVLLVSMGHAYAQDVSDVVDNMGVSSEFLPGLLAASAYLLGLLMGVLGILKLKAHVDSPQQTALREGVIRLLVGGGLFALPIVFEAMKNTIDGGGATAFNQMAMPLSALIGAISGPTAQNLNQVLNNIVTSLQNVPGLVTGVGYLIAILLAVSGILKLRDHVDSPQQTPLREPVIRFVLGGMLFALPAVFHALQVTISGGAGTGLSVLDEILNFALGGGADCSPTALLGGILGALGGLIGGLFGGGGDTVGDAVCNMTMAAYALPAFLNAMAYLFGLFLAIWGLMKLKEHVLNPHQVSIWEPTARLIAAGAFFALPYLIGVARATLGTGLLPFLTSGWAGATSGDGVDALMVRFMADLYGPVRFGVTFFCYVAGVILVMVGISRLIKSANEGPRGPGGLGTLMTFLTAGALLSLGPLIATFSTSFFGDLMTSTSAQLQYTTGMTADEVDHVHAVISAVLQFMILLGMISVARGIFIIRGVAEGNSQASMMAGITHILGGALAVNLGPVINAVQATLGLSAYGVNFS